MKVLENTRTQDDYEILADFFKIFNQYSSKTTGWPLHRIIRTKKGGIKRWRISYERHQVWFHKNFIVPDLMRLNLRRWEHKNDIPYEEYYKDFFKSDFGFTHAVRKEFVLKVLTLGYVAK
jgi:hypothetical protein